MKTWQSIAADVARKCDEDVHAAIERNMALVLTAQEKAQVAYFAAGAAVGTAGGAFLAIHKATGGSATDEEVADGLWSLLRPMTIRAVQRLRQSKEPTA